MKSDDSVLISQRLPQKIFDRIEEISKERCVTKSSIIANILWEALMEENETSTNAN